MWDCHTFQAYLKQIGKYELWNERIYPGMQRAIIGTMLACQENMDRRPNTFGMMEKVSHNFCFLFIENYFNKTMFPHSDSFLPYSQKFHN